MRVHTVAWVSGLLLAAAVPVAGAQTKSRYGTTATQVQREAAAALVSKPVNDGAGFQLICRGGPGLRVRISDVWLASNGPTSWYQVATMTVDFNRSPQPPDPAGRNLQPGQCSPAGFALRDFDPTQIQDTVSAGQASDNIALSLKRPDSYRSFTARDLGDGYLRAGDSRDWKPEFYKGPVPSTTYQPTGGAAALAGSSPTTRQAISSSAAFNAIAAGQAGTPIPPPPPPPPPPPIVVVPGPAVPVVFSPPLLEDNAQLWACVDTAAGEADAGACSGEESAQVYCQLRGAQNGPDVLIADAQPGIPVRAVNGDVCQFGDACRVVTQLQCDH